MSDGDPAATLIFASLTAEQLTSAHTRGRHLSYDAAIQLALDELVDVIDQKRREVTDEDSAQHVTHDVEPQLSREL
jgi:hypothetical protein